MSQRQDCRWQHGCGQQYSCRWLQMAAGHTCSRRRLQGGRGCETGLQQQLQQQRVAQQQELRGKTSAATATAEGGEAAEGRKAAEGCKAASAAAEAARPLLQLLQRAALQQLQQQKSAVRPSGLQSLKTQGGSLCLCPVMRPDSLQS